MSYFTFLPAAATLALATVLGLVRLRLHPAWSARLLATVASTTTLACVGTLAFIAINYAASLWPRPADRLPEWMLIGDDTTIPAYLGIPATLLAGAAMAAMARTAWRRRAEVRAAQSAARHLLETDAPIAVAVPGRDGGVLVSRGLLTRLTRAQLHVVFSHEHAHLRHRHHRYLAIAVLATAALPLVRPLAARLRLSIERWADEEAADAVGDRALVARTIAYVAIARTAHTTTGGPGGPAVLAFTDTAIPERVHALLATPPGKNPITGPVILAGTGTTTSSLALVALQLDHALALALL